MKREFLKELGIEGDQADKIMKEHGDTFNQVKQERDSFKQEAENSKEQLTERDNQLNELKTKAGDNEELKSKIEELKTANQQKDDEWKQKLSSQKLNYELDKTLMQEKARNPRAVRALLDTDVIKLDEAGAVTGLSEQLGKLKESDGYLFGESASTPPPGSNDYKPGSPQGGNNPPSADGSELAKATFERLQQQGKIPKNNEQ